MPARQLRFQSALITGASSGLGAGFAAALPAPTRLLLTGRNEPALLRVRAALACAERAAPLVADLATADGRAAVIERAQAAEIDLLVCNAGAGWSGDFLNASVDTIDETVAVNVLAVSEMLHALLPGMIARARLSAHRAGVIVVSSMGAFVRAPAGLACYAATKAFELRLTEALAKECRHDPIDVLAFCPSFTATNFFARAGLPVPALARAPEVVAHEALAALGQRTLHLCSARRHQQLWPQLLRRLFLFNPLLAVWRWRFN